MSRLFLASSSPRRKEILENLGLRFTVRPADIDESLISGEDAASYVLRMAVQKALAAAIDVDEGIIIGADTIVSLDEDILGKPEDSEEARKQLTELSGREHIVITGLGVVDKKSNRTVSAMVQTIVYFKELSEEEIEAYIQTGEPMDKAGSYGIQGKGAVFIRRIEGDYYNVVGLPVAKLYSLLTELGYDYFDEFGGIM
ncbi:MAG: Maf family protein [Bacillota bacterium]|nr:Maf family protein [Bacillota bacterium]